MGRSAVVRDYSGVSAADRRADRRRRLLEAGRLLWGESGIGEVSVRGVCGRAGLVPRYFYEQFTDRDALVVAIADQVRDELFSTLLTSGLSHPGDLADKLRAALEAFLHLVVDDPHVHRIFSDVLSSAGPLAEPRRQALGIVTDLAVEHGAALLQFERPSPDEMRRATSFIVGGVSQLVDSWIHEPQESTVELAHRCTEFSLAIVRMHAPPQH
jgi:AcrR family transcriptional regulator